MSSIDIINRNVPRFHNDRAEREEAFVRWEDATIYSIVKSNNWHFVTLLEKSCSIRVLVETEEELFVCDV